MDRFCFEFTFTSNTKEKLALFENMLLSALLSILVSVRQYKAMNSGSAAMATAPRFPDLQHHFDAGQAAEQVSHLATDIGCAVECVTFVLRELSTVCAANKTSSMVFTRHVSEAFCVYSATGRASCYL